tara:strand:- start:82 stop:246 length:165 start_codon:yes stop_codon:yes gene_type:complete
MLERQEKRLGKDSFAVKMLRDQIHAQGTKKSAEQIYVTGSVKKNAPTEGIANGS